MTPFLIAVSIGIVMFTCIHAKRTRDFKERFPPISDTEFLALCKPGTNPEVSLKVRRIVADHFAIEYERVSPSMRFIEDIGAD
jgi:hypothetical protein